jgi:fucose 4-O-acetylase-like acetyltransferase
VKNDRISSAAHQGNLKILGAVSEPASRSADLQEGPLRRSVQATKSRARLEWVDVARGVGIVLVVAGHVLGGLIDAGITPETDWFRPALLTIYLFHMPLFFFLSGLFIVARIDRGQERFLREIARGIVWPYFLWGLLQTLVAYLASNYTNTPIHDVWPELGKMFTHPPAQFWFLYGLFVAQILALIVVPRIGAPGFFLLSLALFCLDLDMLPPVFDTTSRMLPFFALGIWLGRVPALTTPAPPVSRMQAAGLVALALVAVWLSCRAIMADVDFAGLRTLAITRLAWGWPHAVTALLGLSAAIALALHLPPRLREGLRYLGSLSMAIFVLHIMVIAGTRIVLVRIFHFEDPAMLAVLLTTLGVGAPLLAAEIARKFELQRVLAL